MDSLDSAYLPPSFSPANRVASPSTGKFLLVQEFGASGWWLPGGRIDPGKRLDSCDAAPLLSRLYVCVYMYVSGLRTVCLSDSCDAAALSRLYVCVFVYGPLTVSISLFSLCLPPHFLPLSLSLYPSASSSHTLCHTPL